MSFVSGDFHYWIHVIGELETVSEEDKKESQNYEWKGKSHLETRVVILEDKIPATCLRNVVPVSWQKKGLNHIL